MNITDLAETDVQFEIEFAGDSIDLWDYNFYARVHGDYEYMQSMNNEDITQLRNNCKKILDLTESVNRGY